MLPDAFSDASEAETENGRPEYAVSNPLTLQPPAKCARAPSFAQRLPLPKGSSATTVILKLCGRSKGSSARDRRINRGIWIAGRLSLNSSQQMPMALEKVYPAL